MISSTNNRIARALSRTGLSARVLAAVAFAGVVSVACDVHKLSAPGTVYTITVSPTTALAAGSRQQMLVTGRDADGRVVAITPTWTIAASGGTVDNSGMFTAGTVPGTYDNTVVASVGAISGRASVTVTPSALASIVVGPTPVTMTTASSQQFAAVGKDAYGNTVLFTPTWSVVANGGTITGAGVFTASGPVGTYTNTVQASHDGIKGFATIASIAP